METNRAALLTCVAPIAWGTTYLVAQEALPADRPLFSAAVRALPAGLLLLAVTRRLPPRGWRLRALVLALTTVGAFFPLIFLAAAGLPSGLAATVQAASPLAVMALAAALLGERATRARLGGALVGLAGVVLLVLRTPDGVTALGLAAAVGSVLSSALGFVLLKRWSAPAGPLTVVSWQLTLGGLVLVPVALLVEGAPPAIDGAAAAGYLWIGGVGTAVAFACWFHGLQRLPAGRVAVLGLLNPAVGTLLGAVVAGEAFGPAQGLGLALVLGGVLVAQHAPPSGVAAQPISTTTSLETSPESVSTTRKRFLPT
ncbi:DMT family transporter [Nocardioides sp.]|uniref:DMT family transporter n=1 Tax=Nocardioides sp. TaxID=35761 RepID=UPI0035183323